MRSNSSKSCWPKHPPKGTKKNFAQCRALFAEHNPATDRSSYIKTMELLPFTVGLPTPILRAQ